MAGTTEWTTGRPGPVPVRAAGGWIAGRPVALVLILLLALAGGCGLARGPETNAGEWIQALAAQDGLKLASLTCDAEQGNLQKAAIGLLAVGALGGVLGGAQPQWSIEQLRYETIRNDGTRADVRVSGRVRVAIRALSQAQDISGILHMRYESGVWRYCGAGPDDPASR